MLNSPRIAVVGLGSCGAFALRHLARAGATVTGYEQFSVGHDRGAFAGETRGIRVLYGEGPEYVPLLQRARQLWEELQFEENADIFYRNGALSIAPVSSDWITNTLKCADTYNLPVKVFDSNELRKRFPFFASVEKDEAAIYDPLGGILRTNESVARAVRSAKDAGATVQDWTPVHEITLRENGVEIRTDHDVARFDRVVVCAGPWVSRLLNVDARVVPVTYFLHVVTDPNLNMRSFPNCMHMGRDFSYEMKYATQPMPDGQVMKYIPQVPSYFPEMVQSDAYFNQLDADVHKVPDEEYKRAAIEVAERMNGVEPIPIRGFRAYDAFTYDDHPFLGEVPGMPGVVTLAGGSGHSFKLAPAYGELLAGLALGRNPEIPSMLSTERIANPR